ncbi:MAG: hypothetical protein MPJ06_01915 [Nitrosopumilus sp.]|nr:hypothetical protein [Nitrosopumilus sp.]
MIYAVLIAAVLAIALQQAAAAPVQDGDLQVSSGVIGGPAILEVRVGGGGAEPVVTVSGTAVRMARGADGAWYAYVADAASARIVDAATRIPGTGMDFGTECADPSFVAGGFARGVPVFTSADACGPQAGSGHMAVLLAPEPVDGDGGIGITDPDHWPFIQLVAMDEGALVAHGASEMRVSYGRSLAGSASFSLDRAEYAPGDRAGLRVTDPQLNLDPTGPDSWTFDIKGGQVYRLLFDGSGDVVRAGDGSEIDGGDIYHYGGTGAYMQVRAEGPAGASGNALQDVSQVGGSPVTLVETGSNTGVFTNTDGLGAPNILVGGTGPVTVGYHDGTGFVSSASAIGTVEPGPPPPLAVSGPLLYAGPGVPVESASAGQSVLVGGTVSAPEGPDRGFAYIVKIEDASGTAVHITWVEGNVKGGGEASMAVSWIPPEPGAYSATVFVWRSVADPVALAPPGTVEFTAG